jgi:hypothetical protein
MGPRPRVPTTDQTRSHLLSHVGDLVRSLGPDVIDDLQRGVEPLRRELLEDPLELRRDALLVGMYRQPRLGGEPLHHVDDDQRSSVLAGEHLRD